MGGFQYNRVTLEPYESSTQRLPESICSFRWNRTGSQGSETVAQLSRAQRCWAGA